MSTANRRAFSGYPSSYRIAEEDRYCCLLDQQPDPLIPDHLREALTDVEEHVINRVVRRQPSNITLNERFSNAFPVVWVRDPIREMTNPFWISTELLEKINSERARELLPDQLAILRQAGILVSNTNKYGTQQWETAVTQAAQKFQQDGYAVVRDLLHPFHLASLRRYYRRLSQTGGMFYGDPQSPHRYITHNEPVSVLFHRQLNKLANRICQILVKPSYAYVSAYQSGAALPRHKDRPQCEYSISLLIDFVPQPEVESPWPLHLITSDGDQALYQNLGDAIFYRGRQLPHYRDPLPEGQTSTSMFFHFVDENFSGPLD